MSKLELYKTMNSQNRIRRNRKMRLKQKAVLKMLSVMEGSQSACPTNKDKGAPPTPDNNGNAEEFLMSGRTGRRNALPDILGQHASVTSSDLPTKLQALSTKDKNDPKGDEAGTSKS